MTAEYLVKRAHEVCKSAETWGQAEVAKRYFLLAIRAYPITRGFRPSLIMRLARISKAMRDLWGHEVTPIERNLS